MNTLLLRDQDAMNCTDETIRARLVDKLRERVDDTRFSVQYIERVENADKTVYVVRVYQGVMRFSKDFTDKALKKCFVQTDVGMRGNYTEVDKLFGRLQEYRVTSYRF